MPSDEAPPAASASSVATSSGSEDGGHHGDGRIERDISTTYGTQGQAQRQEADEYGHTDSEQSYDSDEYSSDGSYDSDEYYTESEDEDDYHRGKVKKSGGWWPFGRSAPKSPAKNDTEAEASEEEEGSDGDDEGSATNDEKADDQAETEYTKEEEIAKDESNHDDTGETAAAHSDEDTDEVAETNADARPVVSTNDEAEASISQHISPADKGEESADEEDDGESYDSEEGSGESGSSGDYESESGDESVESEDYDEEEEDGQPSLSERRSLLSLAAEHDRVDIINTLLSGGDASGGAGEQQQQQQVDPVLVDLLLNNNPKHEDIFIPPLHVAIASGSTRAVAALLRLGSDPSIRPEVPRGYIPPWVEGGGDTVRTPNTRSSWRKFDGMSAWELAYGREATEEDNDDSGAEEDEPATPARRSFFFGRFGSSAAEEKDAVADDNDAKAGGAKKVIRKRSPLNIAPSKLEGIRHAFTAEALRAIGSDEVHRLAQLVDAGMDSDVEAGGKNLLGWAQEMEVVACVKMLTERWGTVDESENNTVLAEEANASAITSDNIEEESISDSAMPTKPSSAAPSAKAPPPPAPQSIGALRRALEENESLTPALSAMLDNLAEECSISQGLLLSEAGSKASLVNNVRSLKANKAEREDELVFWSGKLEDREWELDDRLRRIAMLGGTEERARVWKATEERVHIKEIEERKKSQQNLTPENDGDSDDDSEDDVHLKAALQAELAASNTKLSQLRASIADLAEENDRNLAEVQRRGLAGAVKLARKLREELRTVEDDLREVRSAEAGLRVRVGLVTAELEKLEVAKANGTKAKTADSELLKEKQSIAASSAEGENAEVDADATQASPAPQEPVAHEDDALISDDEEFQKYVAEQDSAENDGDEESDGSESDEDGVLVERPRAPSPSQESNGELPSESIKAGHSTALVVRPSDSNGFLSTGLWEILKRIVGFGRVAAQESADEVVDGYRQSIADVMIV